MQGRGRGWAEVGEEKRKMQGRGRAGQLYQRRAVMEQRGGGAGNEGLFDYGDLSVCG